MKKLSFNFIALLTCISFTFFASAESNTVRIPGKVEGFGSLPVDDVVDGALVLKSFKPMDILQFNIDRFVAPNEPMKAGPQTLNVPGNFYVPRQLEDYGFFRIALEKSEYGYYSEAGAQEEVMALSFKLPFSRLVDMAQNGQATPSKLLPLIRMDRFDFKQMDDYSKVSRLDFRLSQNFATGMDFNWQRSKAGSSESDHVFAFQETPSNRWVLADIVGNAAAKGKLKKVPGMLDRQKILFARLKEANNQLTVIRATVSEGAQVNGVPDMIANARVDGNAVLWTAPEGFGWMSILTKKNQSFALKDTPFWFMDLRGLFNLGPQVSHDWVDARDGSFIMMPPNDGSDPSTLSVTLAYVGTDREVANPDFDPNNELFTYMNKLVVQVLR